MLEAKINNDYDYGMWMNLQPCIKITQRGAFLLTTNAHAGFAHDSILAFNPNKTVPHIPTNRYCNLCNGPAVFSDVEISLQIHT